MNTVIASLNSDKLISIIYKNQRFIGNQKIVLLEQLESQGIVIPYSCRIGICGICKIRLLSGKVIRINSRVLLSSTKWILSCNKIPRSNLLLE